MKILITGGNGYIAKSLYNVLKDKYDITLITRHNFDLTSFKDMNDFFQGKYFDIIIHCAVEGGSRLKIDSYKDMDANLIMYYNLLQHKAHYNKLLHFNSGAETNAPDSPYGLSKRIISKSISEIENFYNLKIFAVFDENEWDTRFIKSNIKRYINKESIIINQDKWMDFFYMKDLVSLIEFYILNNDLPKEIDCSYSNLYKLSDVANIINNLSEYKVYINIENKEIAPSYCGKANTMLDFIGLENGIQEVYNKLK